MKVLVLGDLNSIWEKEFIEYVLLPMGADVFLLGSNNSKTEYLNYYLKAGITIIEAEVISTCVMSIPKLRVLIMNKNIKKTLRCYAPFDIIINIFVSPIALLQALLCSKKGNKIIAFFCGSDIIRASKWRCCGYNILLRKINRVVLASNSVLEAYEQKISNSIGTPYSIIRLGISKFDLIDNKLLDGEKNSYKRSFSIDLEKTSICIGYNASEAQNHLSVLEQIGTLSQKTLDSVVILLPMTYGGSHEYISKVDSIASRLGCDYIIFRQYMDESQIAELRLATDIFINAQVSDGLSGSVLEAIYANADLLNAAWLNYQEYLEWGLKYTTFETYQDIPKLVVNSIKLHGDNCNNRKLLQEKMSWNHCLQEWSFLFNTIKEI